MHNESVSPAVISLLNEQAGQTAKRKTRLDKGLEDTFPASDPVSVTHTATATGSTAAEAEPHESELLGLHPSNDPSDDHPPSFTRYDAISRPSVAASAPPPLTSASRAPKPA